MAYMDQKTVNTVVLTHFFNLAQTEVENVTAEEVHIALNKRIGLQRVELALEALTRSDALDKATTVSGDLIYSVTSTGYGKAEELYLKPDSMVRKIAEKGFEWFFDSWDKRSSKDNQSKVPASDRFVTISDNLPGYQEVTTTVEAANENIRGSNQLEADEKSWIRIHLDLGLELLKKGGKVLVSAIKSLLIEPLESALKEKSEEKMKTAIKAAITAIKTYFGM